MSDIFETGLFLEPVPEDKVLRLCTVAPGDQWYTLNDFMGKSGFAKDVGTRLSRVLLGGRTLIPLCTRG